MQSRHIDTYHTIDYPYSDQEDSGFKAWQADSLLITKDNTNLLRSLKSQLLTYQRKYKKTETNKTLSLKLPSLESIKPKRYHKKNLLQKTKKQSLQEASLTQRNILNPLHNENQIPKHKIPNHKKKSAQQKSLNLNSSSHKLKLYQQNFTINNLQPMNQPTVITTKVKQMNFVQNQKIVRKRDLYLAIFGEKGKGKVQKIEFDDENKAYQVYLDRRNQQMKGANQKTKTITGQQDKSRVRCSSQLYSRHHIKKPQPIGQSNNFIVKNVCPPPMRY